MTRNERAQQRRRKAKRFRVWARRVRLSRRLAWALAALAVLSGVATIATWTGEGTATGPDPKWVMVLLYVDVVVLLLLGAVVARRLVSMWSARKRGRAGSGLHIRIVMLFSLVAVAPAVLVAVFAAMFLNIGIQSWFNDRVSTAISASGAVAEAYLEEHQNNIRADALAVAQDLNREAPNMMRSAKHFQKVIDAQAAFRSLMDIVLVDGRGRILAKSALSLYVFDAMVPPSALEEAKEGKVAVLADDQGDKVRAVAKLERFDDAYLVISRWVEAGALEHVQRTKGAAAEYKDLEKRHKRLQVLFVAIFVVVALLLLMAAVWLGMMLATQIARPISDLISASDRVRKGDLTVRVPATASADEIGALARAFNRMTSRIESQQEGLVQANRELDERRRFTETVLEGVSAGVIGLDNMGNIHLPNRSASDLLGVALDDAIGHPLGAVAPEMGDLVSAALAQPDRTHQDEIRISRDGHPRILLSRVAAERLEGEVIGYVLTFDDVTELVSAQRAAAWADVARRIAHEIKNPLTPIQLSAERLKRKYLKEINSDPEIFTTCTETIVRQVEDIGRMVDEFSSFARMPQASLKTENLSDLCRQVAALERNRQPGIRLETNLPNEKVLLRCDSRQISQAMTNLLKNATESISARKGADLPEGLVSLAVQWTVEDGRKRVRLVVEDNGRGLPDADRDRLAEPYVTTREKGTGLGLAIVKKIMEDHEGDLLLEDREGGGARVSLAFGAELTVDGEDAPAEADPMDAAIGATLRG